MLIVCVFLFLYFLFVYAAIEIFSMNKVEYKNGSNTKTRIRWWNKAVGPMYYRRAFSVAGPMAWNSLPDFIRDPTSSTDCFRRLLMLVRALLVHPAH